MISRVRKRDEKRSVRIVRILIFPAILRRLSKKSSSRVSTNSPNTGLEPVEVVRIGIPHREVYPQPREERHHKPPRDIPHGELCEHRNVVFLVEAAVGFPHPERQYPKYPIECGTKTPMHVIFLQLY